AWDRTLGLDNRNGQFRYTSFTGFGRPVVGNLPGPANTEDWTFVAASYDSAAGTVSVYVDVDASSTDDELVAVTETARWNTGWPTFAIGGIRPDNTSELWDGVIDNVFVYNEVLSPAEIAALRTDFGIEISDPNIVISRVRPLFGMIRTGIVPETEMRSITIRNTGEDNDLNITEIAITGDDASAYSLTDAPFALAPGEEKTIEITLTTGGVAGDYVASLEIQSDDSDKPTEIIELDATIELIPPATLLAFYTFDDPNDPFADSSGNGNDLAQGNGVAPSWGADIGFKGSGAHDFSGGTLVSPIDINAGPLPDMAWGAWVRTNNTSPGLRKIMGHDNGAWDRTLGLDSRNGQFRYTSFTGFGRPVVGNLPGPANTEDWTFVAANYDSEDSTVSVYVDVDASSIDDDLVKVTEPTRWNTGQATFAIGGLRPDNTAELWDGAIDNVFVYEGILTDEEMKDLRDRAAIAGEVLRITEVVRNPDNSITLTWTSNPNAGTTYTVLFSQDLSDPLEFWGDDDDSVASGGETTTHTTGIFEAVDKLFLIVKKNE
ncbi:MAG: LamG-like jellyroll fold domain-containing protein, partial [Verrucomicrobiota bacterium]|nr:LamG-like jellyroll fold domain-containing protein [Verrucomicrobiota bacterium]